MEQGTGMSRIVWFLRTGIWRADLKDYRGLKRFGVKYLRIFLIAGEQFFKDQCVLWAYALTLYSLLSLVPVLAMGFAVAKGFGLQEYLEKMVVEQFAGQQEVFTRLLEYSSRLLENTSGGVIAGVGAIFLIWSVFRILDLAEQAFNDIWEIDRGRPLGRKLSDYLSIMLVSPVLIVTSSSAVVLLATKINVLLERLGLGLFAPVITLGLAIVPYVLIWLLLTFVYVFLPNTKVKPLSGLIGGIMAGTAFVLVQWGYINFQVGVASYNAIYGSFAALPLFLIWLNISWFIVLFGVEIVYAHQNQETYGFERVAEKISHSQWTLLSLQVAHLLVKNFRDGDKPLEVSRVCADLKIPHGIVSGILDSLAKAGLAVAIPVEGTDMKAYQPAKDTDLITVASVIEALEESGVSDIPVARTPAFERIEKSLEEFARLTEGSDANLRLKDI